jgi:hypothetical protein
MRQASIAEDHSIPPEPCMHRESTEVRVMTVEPQTFDNEIDIPPPAPPPNGPLFRSYSGPIGNPKEEIEAVNNNRGTRVILRVNGGMYTTWYYYQDVRGNFYYITVTNFGHGPDVAFLLLDGPIDVNELDS